MTIKEFVLNQDNQSINDWLTLCKKNNFNELTTDLIIQCADQFDKIIINNEANFLNAINL